MIPQETAAVRLVAILERENAALAAMDLTAAVRLLTEKRDAIAAYVAVWHRPDHDSNWEQAPEVALARRLRDLATDNKRMLERALVVQGRVIALIAGALPLADPAPRYAANGGVAPPRRIAPHALSARA